MRARIERKLRKDIASRRWWTDRRMDNKVDQIQYYMGRLQDYKYGTSNNTPPKLDPVKIEYWQFPTCRPKKEKKYTKSPHHKAFSCNACAHCSKIVHCARKVTHWYINYITQIARHCKGKFLKKLVMTRRILSLSTEMALPYKWLHIEGPERLQWTWLATRLNKHYRKNFQEDSYTTQ